MGRTQARQKDQNFQVAILVEDIADAKAISEGLREIGIFAHYYQDLDELWVSLNTYTPDFCIIDIKKMSQGSLLFKQHPKIASEELKYAFYYKDSAKVLLQSTYGLNHYGYIRADINLVDQLKSVLRRRNEELRLSELNSSMNERVNRLRLRGQRLAQLQEKSAHLQQQDELLAKLIRSFGVVETVEDFNKRLVTLLDQWDQCLEFGVYELNSSGQKLMAPRLNRTKYRVLPDLWLAQKSEGGINSYAQDMAFDVAYGLMDEGVLTLKIEGAGIDPDILILGQFEQQTLKDFNWEYLEMKLSSEYRRAILRSQRSEQSKNHHQSVFELLHEMDDINFNQAESLHRHVLVDFGNLLSFTKQRPNNRFFWKSFARDFLQELEVVLSGRFRLTSAGVGYFVASLEKKNLETDYTNLKRYVESFECWRYFEDSSLVITTDVSPSIRLVAPASLNLLRQIQPNHSSLNSGLLSTREAKPQLEL